MNLEDFPVATPEEILTVLENLLHAFPGHKLSRATFEIYIFHLSDIHPHLLHMCADNLIAKSTWFPRVSEIRSEAARIVGPHMVSYWEPSRNYLWDRYYELQHQFYHHRILDSDAWLSLAEEFARRDRPYSAAGARQRLSIFQQILDKESKAGVGKAHLPHKQYP